MPTAEPPPAEGVRLDWLAVPARIRAAVEQWAGGAVVEAASQRTGFSARLRFANGRRVFVKAVGPAPNPDAPPIHRHVGQIVAALPHSLPVPALLWSYDDIETGWIVLVFQDIDGENPRQPWRTYELDRVVAGLVTLAEGLTPSPLQPPVVGRAEKEFATRRCGWQLLREKNSPAGLDEWSVPNLATLADLETAAPAAVTGNTLLNFDVRADNLLLTAERVWFFD